MSLWYSISHPKEQLFNQISLARYTNNSNAFLVCGGPSLNFINPDVLKGPGRTVLGMNNVYPFVKPDIWLGLDKPDCYNRQLFWESFIKIMRFDYRFEKTNNLDIVNLFNMFFIKVQQIQSPLQVFTDRKNYIEFAWQKNTFTVALQLLVWMGFNKIYIFGCDFDNSKQHYYNNVVLEEQYKNLNTRLYNNLNEYLEWFSVTAEQYGINVYSCSPDSKINEYLEYKNYKTVITDIERNIPHGGQLLHSFQVHDLNKSHS